MVKDRIEEIKGKEEYIDTLPYEITDVVVIGSGIAGLTTAALLTMQGIKTYLVEKNEHVGGYFSSFYEAESIFDYAISYCLSFDEQGEVTKLLNKLNINNLEVIRLDKLDHFILQDNKHYRVPANCKEYISFLQDKFPEESGNITNFFSWLEEYDNGLKKKNIITNTFIIKNFLKEYETFIRSYFTNQDLINILSMRIQAYPPSLFIMGGFLNECLLRGMYYVKGGFGKLSLAIAENIKNNNGGIGLNRKVEKVIYNPDKEFCYTLCLSTGEQIQTKYIVNNSSPMNLINMYHDPEHILEDKIEKLKKQISGRKLGHSSINVYLKVKDLDVSAYDCGRIYIIPSSLEHFDVFQYYKEIEDGVYYNTPILKIHIPTYYDDTLADSSEHIIRVETDMCNDFFLKYKDKLNQEVAKELELEKDKILQYVLEQLSLIFQNDISKKVTYAKVLTPLEFEELTLNNKGSGTGWAHTVDNYFKNIFPTKMVLPNCYIVGQWGEIGSGLRQLIITATKAAEDIISRIRK